MATHASILAWEILGTEEPVRLHTVPGVTKVGHNLVTKPPWSLYPGLGVAREIFGKTYKPMFSQV